MTKGNERAVSLPKRIREWGGRELTTVSLCFAIGLVVGILLSLFEDAENVINSSQQELSRGILFSPAAQCSPRLAMHCAHGCAHF